ncbi:hypothetical protein NUACC26_093350 [Scytonema sp. NUACC26]
MLEKAEEALELPMEPDLELDMQLLRQQIAKLTEANVTLQTELAKCRQAEVALQGKITQAYRELNKLKGAEQLAHRQTTVLVRTLEELVENPDLDRFLGQVMIAIAQQLNVPITSVWLVDSAKEVAYLYMMCYEGQILTGEQQLGHPNATVPDSIADSAAWQTVYSARRLVIHSNIANNPVFKPSQREWLIAHSISKLLSVPLLLGSETIGKLTLALKDGNFTAESVKLSQALAHQVTLALHINRLVELSRETAILQERNRLTQERAAELAKANEVLQAEITERHRAEQVSRGQTETLVKVLTVLNAEPVLNDNFLGYVLQAIAEQLGECSGGVWLYDQIQDNTVLHVNYEDSQIQPVAQTSTCVPLSQNPLRKWDEEYLPLLREKKILIHKEQDFTQSFAYAPYCTSLAKRGIKTILIVPLVFAQTLLGYLTIRSKKQRDYKLEELELARVLAYQASLAIQIARLAKQAQESAVLEERNRMARELHDNLAQGFTGIVVQLEGAENVLTKAPQKAQMRLNRARQLARESLAEVRRSVRALRPQALEASDLARALVSIAERMTQDTSVKVSFQVTGTYVLLQPNVEENLLRICQEALTNVLKHTCATNVWIELVYTRQEVCLSVHDDGQGFDLDSQRQVGNSEAESTGVGFGLTSMRERAEYVGGRLTITSKLGQGTKVSVAIPVLPNTK